MMTVTVVWIAVRTLKGVPPAPKFGAYHAPYDNTSAAAAMKKMPGAFKAMEFNNG